MRFFNRAIDCYDEALRKFPGSFDLAYNKGRIQYEVTQHPKLQRLLPKSPFESLQTALASSKYALSLQPENPDALFNNAQVLTSIIEELDGLPHPSFPEPGQVLHEALMLFQKCLQEQEAAARENLDQSTAMMNYSDTMDFESASGDLTVKNCLPSSDSEDLALKHDRWATVIEPVTSDTLLDTILASLETLSTFCQLISPKNPNEIHKAQEYAEYLNSKLEIYLTNRTRFTEARVTQSSLTCALANAQFHFSLIDIATYSRIIQDAYKDIDLSSNPKGLCDFAESLVLYNSVLRFEQSGSTRENLGVRWEVLTKALDKLSSASKLPSAENVEKIHLARGNVELLRYQLGQSEHPLAVAKENARVLLKNAAKYFRGSSAIAKSNGMVEIEFEANLKELLTSALVSDEKRLWQYEQTRHQQASSIIRDAVDEGLITIFQLSKAGFEFTS
ncbi:hypothetical protein GcM1_188017 [Golovinomyces cichoracearum]|uniref:Uncharacterized protein n=1 Tax=Golovinomyces cichoracearum TaxID=62708 RepID=A0A420J2A5_9PEZI|nr:hypothetical protein GcM1_188017 [Golovinomyces cichoracearum]